MSKPKKGAPAPSPAMSGTIPSDQRQIPLNRLVVDSDNVRAEASADDQLDILAASIKHVGLLQPLVVVARGEQWGVVAGRRRLLALQVLALRGDIDPDHLVETREVHPAYAAEASLAENYARQQMTVRETYLALAALAEARPDASVEALGAAFGFDAGRTGRILRLAHLHPEVMAAWEKGEFEDAVAFAFASTENQDAQLAAYSRGKPYYGGWTAEDVRRRIRSVIQEEVDNNLVQYVGEEAYLAAGGRVETDLFTDHKTLLDGALVARLAAEKLEADKAELLAHTWSDGSPVAVEWLSERPDHGEGYPDYRLELRFERNPDAPTAALLDAGADELDALIDASLEAETALYDYLEEHDCFDEDDEVPDAETLADLLTSEQLARVQELQAALDQAEAAREAKRDERDALLATVPLTLPLGANGAKEVYAFATIRNGQAHAQLWWKSRADAGLPDEEHRPSAAGVLEAGRKAAASEPPFIAEKKKLGLSRDGFMAMQLLFADAASAELVAMAEGANPTGLDLLLFMLARKLHNQQSRGYHPDIVGLPSLRIEGDGTFSTRQLLVSKDEDEGEGEWQTPIARRLGNPGWLVEGHAALAWDQFREWVGTDAERTGDSDAPRYQLGAVVLGFAWHKLANQHQEAELPPMVRLAAEAVDPGPLEWAARFDRARLVRLMSHKARKELLASWGLGEAAKSLKKDDSAAYVVKILDACRDGEHKQFGVDDETRAMVEGWLPSLLEIRPVERPEPEPAPEPEEKPKAKGARKKGAAAEQGEDARVPEPAE